MRHMSVSEVDELAKLTTRTSDRVIGELADLAEEVGKLDDSHTRTTSRDTVELADHDDNPLRSVGVTVSSPGVDTCLKPNQSPSGSGSTLPTPQLSFDRTPISSPRGSPIHGSVCGVVTPSSVGASQVHPSNAGFLLPNADNAPYQDRERSGRQSPTVNPPPRAAPQLPDRAIPSQYYSYYRQALSQLGHTNADRNARHNATGHYYSTPMLDVCH